MDDYDDNLFSQLPLQERMLLRELRRDKLYKYSKDSAEALKVQQDLIKQVSAQSELLREEVCIFSTHSKFSLSVLDCCRRQSQPNVTH